MSPTVEFPAEAVLRHSDSVRGASDELATARSAVGEVVMDSQAYGQLCQFLPALLSPLFGTATGVMNDAVEALGETARKLRTTASAMTTADAGSAGRLEAAAGPGIDLPL
ncbi:type VII secretion target [Actinoplanes sp. CA-142083]|uniref:type VII secretion target n=1 Tax=Actinoplanes sp. CA-142083 TaxID=3239903 RepID=UPI003D90B24C